MSWSRLLQEAETLLILLVVYTYGFFELYIVLILNNPSPCYVNNNKGHFYFRKKFTHL